MKKFLGAGLLVLGLFQSGASYGLVMEKAMCKTSDGKYSIFIADNMGIGPIRRHNLYGTIKNENDDVVGSYSLKFIPRTGSISFGHASYVDQPTNGQEFDFALPSTNTPYALTAVLNDGEEIAYGLRFNPEKNQGELTCQVFGF